jgi:hypothetical protein
MGVSYVADVAANYTTLIDEQGSVSYVGRAAPGSITSAPVWQLQRITQTETSVAVEYANGNDSFNNVWDNRAAQSYS